MAHVVRAWRASRTIRLLVLVASFAAATQLVLSQDSRAVHSGARQTKNFGAERLISATAGSRPVPSLNFDEACEAAPSSPASHQAVRHAARLVIILLDKILSTIESNY